MSTWDDKVGRLTPLVVDVLKYVRKNPVFTQNQIYEATSWGATGIGRACQTFERLGLVDVAPGPRNSKIYTWREKPRKLPNPLSTRDRKFIEEVLVEVRVRLAS